MSANAPAPRRVSDLFHRALEHAPHSRESFLKTACGDNHSLLAEVRDLLANYQEVDTSAVPAAPDPLPGTRFGAYEIVRLIGFGGMGRVYLGRRADGAFTRDVAIKVIESSKQTQELITRFEQERRILGSLRHPCIAQLFDAGRSESGHLYFVMEYIDGLPITEFCDRRQLGLVDRLHLFCRVCGAVEEAHRSLIVHRDLKPGNILVDASGTPKLLDFGIAKPLTQSGLEAGNPTLPILRRATPAYASPEQLQGDAAHTGMDVFSLGVVLHELVTGFRPSLVREDQTTEVQGGSFAAPSATVARQGGVKGAGITARDVEGDLDAIILKALDPEVGRRYGSVSGLLNDLRAYLEGYPVGARPVTRVDRLRRFVRRNRGLTALSAAATVAALVATVSVAYIAITASRDRDTAVAQLDALRALASSTFALDQSLARVSGATEPRRQLVAALNDYLSRIRVGDDRTLALETAEGYRRLGDIQGNPNGPNLGDLPGALRSYEAARTLLGPLHTADPSSQEVTGSLVRVEAAIGDVLFADRSLDAAGAAYANALALADRLVDEGTNAVGNRVLRAGIHRPYGDLARAVGDGAAAQSHYEKALAIDLANTTQFPEEPEYRRLLALSYLRIAGLQAAQGVSAEARATYERAADLLNGLARRGEIVSVGLRREVAFGRARLGVLLEAEGNPAGRAEIRAAAEVFRGLAEADPADVRSRRDLLATLVQLGDAVKFDDPAAARQAYRDAREIALTLAAGEEPEGPGARDLALVNRRMTGLATGDMTHLKLFKVVDGRRVLLQTGDPPPQVRTPIAAASMVSPGWSRYLLVFGSDGPVELLDQTSSSDWVVPAAGPPPAQTILLLAAPQPLSAVEKRQLSADLTAIPGPRTIDWESQVVWDSAAETIETMATARSIEPSPWMTAVRDRISKLPRVVLAGRTFPLAPQ
jgi:non-specific serine/threonine protein kinase/serine/threonine-protein kinase